jgi:hypothetical protein
MRVGHGGWVVLQSTINLPDPVMLDVGPRLGGVCINFEFDDASVNLARDEALGMVLRLARG